MTDTITAVVGAAHRLVAACCGVDLRDDRGADESTSKMIWIAAVIVIAGLAVAFAVNVFNESQQQVPQVPAAPGGGG